MLTTTRRGALGWLAAAAVSGNASWAWADRDPLKTLADLLAARLALMPDVARHKYNTGAAVEDLPREAQVLAAVTAQAERAGIERDFAARFFQAQIDAAKMIQQAEITGWMAEKREKFANVPDLATEIRPRLDALTPQLIAALAAARPLPADGAARLEKLAAVYAAAHNGVELAAFRHALAPLSN